MKTPDMRLIALSLAGTLLVSGCTATTPVYTTTEPVNDNSNTVTAEEAAERDKTKRGALIGAGIGAVVGAISGDDAVERRQRALIGAGVGALAGTAIGAYQDKQERELRESLAGTGVDVVRKGDDIVLNMPDNITFAFNSSELNPAFNSVLDKVAAVANQNPSTVLEIAGHTDSIGSDAYNDQLSQRRAQAVGNYLMSRWLLTERLVR